MPDESPLLASARVDAASRTDAACRACGTELSPTLLACPSCRALVHRDRLESLARAAELAEREEQWDEAATAWRDALALLPANTQQHDAVLPRMRAAESKRTAREDAGWFAAHKGRWGIVGAVAIFALTKGKLLLLGLTKASTLLSMLAFLGVYWNLYGWAFALGMVLSIYVHEMGHVAALRRLGIRADAPLFIPGVGALVLLKEHPTDPRQDADIGLAGPTWGLAAAVVALVFGYATKRPVFTAIGHSGAFLNLFNLVPIWQLDGARGFHALSRAQRWATVPLVALVLAITGQRVLWLVLGCGVWQCFRAAPREHHWPTLARYAGLVVALTALSLGVVRS